MKRNKNLPYHYGDICFLPEQVSQKEINNSVACFLNRNKEMIKKEFGKVSSIFLFLEILKRLYRDNGSDFPLFEKLYRKIQNYISTHCAIMHEDPYAILPLMPYTKFGYITLCGGIFEDTIQAFELYRLKGIKQLGFMMDPFYRERDPTGSAMNFRHTRELHSLDTATILRLIELNNPDARLNKNLLSIGGISHDGMTPAGGDTTKLVDLDFFNEDTHYEKLFEKPKWNYLKKKYKVSEDELKEMILNHGIHGQLLDIADKIAYVSRDTYMFVGFWEKEEDTSKNVHYHRIKELIELYPNFCDIWKSVKIHDGKVVIEDGFGWGIFLTIRALMYAALYYNSASRYLEYMLSKRIIAYLFKSKIVDPNQLFSWGDWQLEEKIYEFLGKKYYPICFKKSYYKKFETRDEFENEVHRLRKVPDIVAIPDDFKCVTKTGVDKYWVRKNEKVMIFKEAFPEMSADIEEIMTFPPCDLGLYVISLTDLEVPPDRQKYVKRELENL